MSRFKKYGSTGFRAADCKRIKGESPVHPNLAVPPSKMFAMAEQGVSISVSNASNFYDGSDNPSFDLPLDCRRGIDVATLWEESKRIKGKMSDGLKNDIENYG